MAKQAQFQIDDFKFSAGFDKVDRKKIYGYSKVEVKNEDGEGCSLANVTSDGMHILPSGCTGIINLNEKGEYVARSSMIVVNKDGNPVEKVLSTFDEECIKLEKVNDISEYMSLNVKAIYQLDLEENKNELRDYLNKEHLLKFSFNYRTDYEADDAFMLTNNDEIFVVTGKQTKFEFLGFENQIEEVMETEEDDLDFGML